MKYYKHKTDPNIAFAMSEPLSDTTNYIEITKEEYEAKISEIESKPKAIPIFEFEIVQLDMVNKILKIKPKTV
jgi:hypothetical protein